MATRKTQTLSKEELSLQETELKRKNADIIARCESVANARKKRIDFYGDIARGVVKTSSGSKKYLTIRQRKALELDRHAKNLYQTIAEERDKTQVILARLTNIERAERVSGALIDYNERVKNLYAELKKATHSNTRLWSTSLNYRIPRDYSGDILETGCALYGVAITHTIHNFYFHILKMSDFASVSRINYMFKIIAGCYKLLRCFAYITNQKELDETKWLKVKNGAGAVDGYTTARLDSLNEISTNGAFDIVHDTVGDIWLEIYKYFNEHKKAKSVAIADIFEAVRPILNRNVNDLRTYFAKNVFGKETPDIACTFTMTEEGEEEPTFPAVVTILNKQLKAEQFYDDNGRVKSQRPQFTRTNITKMIHALDRVAHFNDGDCGNLATRKEIGEWLSHTDRAVSKWEYVSNEMGKDIYHEDITPRSARNLAEKLAKFAEEKNILKPHTHAEEDGITETRPHNAKRAVVVTDSNGKTAKYESFTATAKALGISPAYVRKLVGHTEKASVEISGILYHLTSKK